MTQQITGFNFKPIKQTIFNNEDNSILGNCYPTSLACLFGLELDEVPHFFQEAQDQKLGSDAAREASKKWLLDRGVREYSFWWYDKPTNVLAEFGSMNEDALWVLSSRSPRHSEFFHVVICKGSKFLHDPHPDRKFLDESFDGWSKVYVYGFA